MSCLALIKSITFHVYLFALISPYHTGSPFIAPCCTENINKYSGQDIVFNATLEFRNSGACMQHVEIEKRTLEKDSVEFVTCPISNSSDCTTTNSERIKASITETTMVVTISNATQIDSGTYKFFPTTILFRILTKTFIVTVLGTYVSHWVTVLGTYVSHWVTVLGTYVSHWVTVLGTYVSQYSKYHIFVVLLFLLVYRAV